MQLILVRESRILLQVSVVNRFLTIFYSVNKGLKPSLLPAPISCKLVGIGDFT
jgi:hypothetical protein